MNTSTYTIYTSLDILKERLQFLKAISERTIVTKPQVEILVQLHYYVVCGSPIDKIMFQRIATECKHK